MEKIYKKSLIISASTITTANINKAMDASIKTGPITIVLDGKEYKNDDKTKINIKNKGNSEEDIIGDLNVHFDEFTNKGKTIDGSANKYLITEIKGDGVTHNEDMTYTFTQGKPLKIYLKSKKYIEIKYTSWRRLQYSAENDLIEAITNDISVIELFETIADNFEGKDLGTSNINDEPKESATTFKTIDGGEVTITIDSFKIKDDCIRTCFLEPVGSVDFINPVLLDILNDINPIFGNFGISTLNDIKTEFNNIKYNEDGNVDAINGKPIITGPFKIKINGVGNEIESTADETDLKSANFIHLIIDKNTINPYFLKKELKFDIVGGKDNYIISDETKNKIQEYLDNLKNTEEVTEELIFAELKKLENDVFVKGKIDENNIKCYKTGENIAIKSNFGTDITVKIDPKAISTDKIKIKLTLGDIRNNENINLDSAVVTAINEKIKEVKFGISVNEILAILNNDELKSYFTEALVDADILDNTGNALTNNVSKSSTIKIKTDKIKSEYFKKEKEKEKEKDNDENGTQNGDQNDTQNGDQKEKKGGCCGGYGNKK